MYFNVRKNITNFYIKAIGIFYVSFYLMDYFKINTFFKSSIMTFVLLPLTNSFHFVSLVKIFFFLNCFFYSHKNLREFFKNRIK